MVRNIKLIISYDGSNYYGWQKQNDLPTIQQQIEKAIYNITGECVDLVGSGRTDANVHALAQVANFKTNSLIQAEKIKYAINSNINTDIRILNSEEVDLDFNSRFSSKRKTYLYQIYNDRISSPFYEKYSYHIPYSLNVDIMRESLIRLEGNGFLYNMVRIIAGTVIEIGNEKKDIGCIKKAIETGQRTYLGHTAKPQGLFLKEVKY